MKGARLSAFCVVCALWTSLASGNFAGTDIYLPSVGSAIGVAPWYTTVWVYNPGASAAIVTFHLLKRQANPGPATYTDVVPAGDVRRYDDAVQFMFHESVFGALRIVSDHQVLVSSRIYSEAAGGADRDSSGQYFGGIPASFAVGAGETTQIVGVKQTSADRALSDFRFNVGVVETAGSGATVSFRLLDESGGQVGGTRTWSVGEHEQRQENMWDMFPTVLGQPIPNGRIEVSVTGGSGKVIAFGSSIANGSDDPSTVEMVFADSLLADSGGSGTITGVTAGQGLTGGGTSGSVILNVGVGAGLEASTDAVNVAAGGITSAMIADGTVAAGDVAFNYAGSTSKGGAASDLACTGCVLNTEMSGAGAINGQVLKYDGVSVKWDTDNAGGLTLPYFGSASSSGALLEVFNTAGGSGLRGQGTTGWGVIGAATTGTGVYGASDTGAGVHGVGGTSGSGVAGSSTSGHGVSGLSTSGIGVGGYSTTGSGMYGSSTSGRGVGGFSGSNDGVDGTSNSGSGVYGQSANADGVAGKGGRYGVYAVPNGTNGWGYLAAPTVGLYANAGGSGNPSRRAGIFDGDVDVNGVLHKSGGSFKIDDPLDPSGKYLYHSFVESPDMKNVYDGVVVTDESGLAVVELPEWFESLNRDFRYQLTVIGQFAQAIISQEIDHNRFAIKTNLGSVKVSWQVTGIRQDAWANAHRIPVEEFKPPEEQGLYLYPELFGAPEEKGIAWARNPEHGKDQ